MFSFAFTTRKTMIRFGPKETFNLTFVSFLQCEEVIRKKKVGLSWTFSPDLAFASHLFLPGFVTKTKTLLPVLLCLRPDSSSAVEYVYFLHSPRVCWWVCLGCSHLFWLSHHTCFSQVSWQKQKPCYLCCFVFGLIRVLQWNMSTFCTLLEYVGHHETHCECVHDLYRMTAWMEIIWGYFDAFNIQPPRWHNNHHHPATLLKSVANNANVYLFNR